jgi:CxxC-x17-CxxC domain-containing protein
VGKTGTGKTTMIQNMAIQDIQKGLGVAIVDPHGEFAETLIKSIPSNRINDVIYFNPADQDFPIAFNVMEKVDTEYRHLIASGLVGVFKKIWADSWGPRLEYILRNSILALLEYPGSTLLGVTRILVDKNYRDRVVEKITDPVVKSFWVDEFVKWNDRVLQEVISPIQNKVGQFLSSSLIRNIVGQTKSAFSIRELMDEGKILIMNLSKGRIGEDNSALLGAMMITKIQLAAMARVDVPENERRDFYLYVDEFQNFATDSFANILSEARKYRLNLIIAHQYIGQLITDTSTRVRDAVFGNVGTLCVFRVGAEDAEFLEKEFEPIFMAQDLVNLPNRHIYIKLMIDGIAGNAFSATTLPPIALAPTEQNEEKVIKVTRERYGTPREVVEEKIARWSGMLTEKDLAQTTNSLKAGIEKKYPPRKKEENKEKKFLDPNRKTYPAKCATCDVDIEVPFKPDSSRPTFCRDCLKDYQRQQALLTQTKQGGSNSSFRGGENSRKQNSVNSPRGISLSEASRMNPRPFSNNRERPRKQVNLTEVRQLIRESLEAKKS